MTPKEIKAARRRLNILQLLKEDPDYSANEALIQEILDLGGFGVSMDVLRTDLAWLAEQDLVEQWDLPGSKVVSLRGRGVDVAKGLATVPGIARPGPK